MPLWFCLALCSDGACRVKRPVFKSCGRAQGSVVFKMLRVLKKINVFTLTIYVFVLVSKGMPIKKSSVLEPVSLHTSVLDLLSHLYSILWLFLTTAVAETAFSEMTFLSNILKD